MTAIDLSKRMIHELVSAAQNAGLSTTIKAQVADAAELIQWPGRYFHGILATGSVANILYDLGAFAVDAYHLLLPRGRMVVHMLAPGSSWERRARIRSEGREAAAEYFRHRHRTLAVSGKRLSLRVMPPSEAYPRYFESEFHLMRRYGLGFLFSERTMARLSPPARHFVGRLEARLGRLPPFRERSRYFVLDLEKRDHPGRY